MERREREEVRIGDKDRHIDGDKVRERGGEGDREKTTEVKTWRSEQGEKEKGKA